MPAPTAFPRRQLTLFVPSPQAGAIEAVRSRLDPVQHRLIAAHVTVCRDAETATLTHAGVATVLSAARLGAMTLTFGRGEPFFDHGVVLPARSGEDAVARLRETVLGASPERRQKPHITLAHPRNPKSAENDNARAWALPDPLAITFSELAWIEQDGPDEPWRTHERFRL